MRLSRLFLGGKKVHWAVRIARTFGLALAILWLIYLWQPFTIDFIPRRPPPQGKIYFPSEGVFGKGARVLVVTAHPDDDGYLIAGTLAKIHKSGALISNVLLTKGDKRYYIFIDWRKMAETRQAEQEAASRLYTSYRPVFLDYPDGRTKMGERLVEDIYRQIQSFKPTAVISFDPEFPVRMSHRDHRNAGRAAYAAAKKAGFRGWFLGFQTMAPNCACDISKEWDVKEAVIDCYKSQYPPNRMPLVKGSAMERAYQAGAQFGMEMGEPFRAVRMGY
jgi:LmbE family N-acetylglucosaminyl deacetylase